MKSTYFGIKGSLNFFIFLLLIVFGCNVVFSQYSADLVMNVNTEGHVEISGISNYPGQIADTDQITSKSGSVWTLNYTINETFSDYLFEIDFPANTVINYIKSNSPVTFGQKSGIPFVKGIGNNETISILVQYSFENVPTSGSADAWKYFKENVFGAVGGIVFLLMIYFLFVFFGKRFEKKAKEKEVEAKIKAEAVAKNNKAKNKKRNLKKKNDANKLKIEKSNAQIANVVSETSQIDGVWYDKSVLLDRQKDIVEILEGSSDGNVTQKELEDKLKIPKSSVSRNIDSLVKKGIVSKEGKGVLNVIKLNKKKPEFDPTSLLNHN